MRTAGLVAGFVAAVLAAFWLGTYVGAPAPSTVDRTQPRDTPAVTATRAAVTKSAEAVLNSPQTLGDTLELSGDFAQSAALYALASRADEPQLLQLLDEASRIQQTSEREAATSILYARYADLAPTAAVEHALAHGGDDAQDALSTIFHIWCRQDLDGAVARAVDLPWQLRSVVAITMLRARDDLPDDERRRIGAELDMTPAIERMLAAEEADRWTNDPQAGWLALQQRPESSERATQLAAIVTVWARRDPEAALAAVDDVSGAAREMLVDTLARTWADTDVENALTWALGHEKTRGQVNVLRYALLKVAKSEPTRALDIAAAIPVRDERSHTLSRIVIDWADRDLKSAVAWFDAQRDPAVREATLRYIASRYANNDWRGAADWMNRLSKAERSVAAADVAVAMLESDPERAGRLALEQGEMQPLFQLVVSWSEKDPAAAVTWIDANVEDRDSHTALLGFALPRWVSADEQTALRFLDRMDPGPAYDQAAYRSMEVLVHDRAAAERLFEKINDPRLRTEGARRLREMPQ